MHVCVRSRRFLCDEVLSERFLQAVKWAPRLWTLRSFQSKAWIIQRAFIFPPVLQSRAFLRLALTYISFTSTPPLIFTFSQLRNSFSFIPSALQGLGCQHKQKAASPGCRDQEKALWHHTSLTAISLWCESVWDSNLDLTPTFTVGGNQVLTVQSNHNVFRYLQHFSHYHSLFAVV